MATVGSGASARQREISTVPGDFVASMNVREAITNSESASFPSFGDPREIGSFSVRGEQRENVDGPEQLKYLRMPSRRRGLLWDLNYGYGMALRRDSSVPDKLDMLLRWILRNRNKLVVDPSLYSSGDQTQSLQADFVLRRGVLVGLMCTPYTMRDDWLVAACRFRGSIYLYDFETEAQRKRSLEDAADPRRERMTFWGHKFEQYMVSREPDGAPDVDAVVNLRESYSVVLRNTLHSHSLVFDAEVDAADPDIYHRCGHEPHQAGSMAGYVELKTSRICSSERQYFSFCRFKLLKWWAQSFVVGIPRVICGFRDDDGLVRRLEEFHVSRMAQTAQRLWSKAVCMNFCDQVLSFIKQHVEEDDPGVVYLFKYLPSSHEIVCTHLKEPGMFTLLPDWYLQGFDSV